MDDLIRDALIRTARLVKKTDRILDIAEIAEDASEVNRIPYGKIKTNDRRDEFYFQTKYDADDSPLPILTWQENDLMHAELIVRGNGSGDALTLVNNIRASHSLAALAGPITLDIIYIERDKELVCQGNRMPDQRRFDRWHGEPGTWQYFTITNNERSLNTNL